MKKNLLFDIVVLVAYVLLSIFISIFVEVLTGAKFSSEKSEFFFELWTELSAIIGYILLLRVVGLRIIFVKR